jgi:mRNA interferase HigB
VIIISYRTIREFVAKHPDAEDSLNNWYIITEMADWADFYEAREVFSTIDAVGNDLYVFNIRGNRYRLIARIFFRVRTVYIRYIGLHRDYDRLNLKKL